MVIIGYLADTGFRQINMGGYLTSPPPVGLFKAQYLHCVCSHQLHLYRLNFFNYSIQSNIS